MRTGADLFAALARVAATLETKDDQPATTFRTVHEALDGVFGVRLFTILLQHRNLDAERIWTSHPIEYPVAGRKPRNPTHWTGLVLDEGKPFLARTPEEVAGVFFDHELIASLGCGSALNLPCIYRGDVVATLNLLHEPQWYGEEDARAGMPFAAVVAPLIADVYRTV
jgi:hypothetical protein